MSDSIEDAELVPNETSIRHEWREYWWSSLKDFAVVKNHIDWIKAERRWQASKAKFERVEAKLKDKCSHELRKSGDHRYCRKCGWFDWEKFLAYHKI